MAVKAAATRSTSEAVIPEADPVKTDFGIDVVTVVLLLVVPFPVLLPGLKLELPAKAKEAQVILVVCNNTSISFVHFLKAIPYVCVMNVD